MWGMQVEMIIGLVAVTLLFDFGLEHGRELARRCVSAHRDRRWRERSRAHWVRWLAHLEAMRESYARDGLPWHVESVEQDIEKTRERLARLEPTQGHGALFEYAPALVLALLGVVFLGALGLGLRSASRDAARVREEAPDRAPVEGFLCVDAGGRVVGSWPDDCPASAVLRPIR